MKPSERIAFLGKTGSGKSRSAKAFVAGLLKTGERVAVFDPCDEWSRHGAKTAERWLGPLRDRVTVDELLSTPSVLDHSRLSLAIVPNEKDEDEISDEFVNVCELIEATGNLTFVVEEVGVLQGRAIRRLNRATTMWRGWSIPMILVAQRATQIHILSRSQLSEIRSGWQDENADIEALEARCGVEFAQKVATLKEGAPLAVWNGRQPTNTKTAKEILS